MIETSGRRVEATRTSGEYLQFVLPNTAPPKPGRLRQPGYAGPGVDVEIWSHPPDSFGRFVATLAPLGIDERARRQRVPS